MKKFALVYMFVLAYLLLCNCEKLHASTADNFSLPYVYSSQNFSFGVGTFYSGYGYYYTYFKDVPYAHIDNNGNLAFNLSGTGQTLFVQCDTNNQNCSSYFSTGTPGSQDYFPMGFPDSNMIISVDVHSYDGLSIVFSANYILPTSPFFRYPVDFTLDNPNGWSHKVQSFGSLNNSNNAPHAAEDWNKTGGDIGEQLFAIADGTITNPDDGNSTDGWGKTFLIQHNAPEGKHFLTGTGELLSTVYSFYAHMLKSGQDASYDINKNWHVPMVTSVTKGQPVAQVGNADGQWPSHFHFEILKDSSKYRDNPYAWTAMNYRIDPSELINNGLYSDQSTAFSIIVHPYECDNAFKLSGDTPACNNPGNWTRRGTDYGSYELGYSGIIYSKPTEDIGTILWIPNLPKDGQYRVWVYIPNDTQNLYATSENAQYTVSTNSTNYDPYLLNQSANHSAWVNIGTYNLYKEGSSKVSLQGNTSETGKVIAADAVKFEYVGAIQ